MYPPEKRLQRPGSPGGKAHAGEPAADGSPDHDCGLRAVASLRHVEGVDQQRDHHQRRGQPDDHHGVQVAGQVEAEPVRFAHPAARHAPQQRGQDDHGKDVQVNGEDEDAGWGQNGLGQGMPDGVAEDEDTVAESEGQESPEYRGVAQPCQVELAAAGVGGADPLQHLALPQDDGGGSGEALHGPVEPERRPALQDQPEHPPVNHVSGPGHGGDQRQVNAGPHRNCAEYVAWWDHEQLLLEDAPTD